MSEDRQHQSGKITSKFSSSLMFKSQEMALFSRIAYIWCSVNLTKSTVSHLSLISVNKEDILQIF